MRFVLKTFMFISFSALAFVVLFVPMSTASASANDNVYGYAWSDNIGWINFNNCTNPAVSSTCSGTSYGVKIDPANEDAVSGYAWNSNVGWISFNPSDWDSCPPGSEAANICTKSSLNNFSNKWDKNNIGWARVVSVANAEKNASGGGSFSQPFLNTGGWDGWIYLNNPDNFINWDANFSKGTFSGSAWGSDIIGWIDLSTVFVNSPYNLILNKNSPTCLNSTDTPGFWVSGNGSGNASSNIKNCELISSTDSLFNNFSSTHIPDNSPIVGPAIGTITSYYKLQCNVGNSNFIVSSNAVQVKVCNPGYQILSASSCKGVNNSGKLGINLEIVPADPGAGGGIEDTYEGSVDLTIRRVGGYNNNVSLYLDTGPSVGNFYFLTNPAIFYNNVSTPISVKLVMQKADYDTWMASNPSSLPITVKIGSSDNQGNPTTINFCPKDDGSKLKPIYKPF